LLDLLCDIAGRHGVQSALPQICPGLRIRTAGARMAHADLALGGVFRCIGDLERNRLAQRIDGALGILQGVDHSAAGSAVRRIADTAASKAPAGRKTADRLASRDTWRISRENFRLVPWGSKTARRFFASRFHDDVQAPSAHWGKQSPSTEYRPNRTT